MRTEPPRSHQGSDLATDSVLNTANRHRAETKEHYRVFYIFIYNTFQNDDFTRLCEESRLALR